MSKQVKPIKPEDVIPRKQEDIPDEVFEAFNFLIARNFSDGSAMVFQKDVVKILEGKGMSLKEIYENHWLDVEGVYRTNGWKVEYDKPGYNESYDASFVFKASK